jgi:GT2 family glycosyltransferase
MPLSIIIPSRNANNLRTCISAIRVSGEDHRIIIVDDGLELVAANGLMVSVMGHKPFVFARNINLGIYAAGTDDVILLNDDALLRTAGGFTRMWALACLAPEFGVVAASCSNVGNPIQNQRPELAHMDSFREELRTLCFTCVLIPRTVINTVGLLDERFVDYGMDDDDYCLRVRNAGFKLGIFDGCFVDHGSLTSSYRGGPEAGGDFYANLRRFIAKWGHDNWGRGYHESPFKTYFPQEPAA